MKCCVIGEFGRVFKGVWTHQSRVDGKEISEEVAVKTIKSTCGFCTAYMYILCISDVRKYPLYNCLILPFQITTH